VSPLEFTGWIAALMGGIGVLVALARPVLRYLAVRQAAGQSVDVLGVALAFAEGYDAAKGQLAPEAKAAVSGALKAAAERSGTHADVERFLDRFNFNKKPAAPPAS